MLATSYLNISLVEAGLFPSYIQEMDNDVELLAFKRFLRSMHIARQAFIKARDES